MNKEIEDSIDKDAVLKRRDMNALLSYVDFRFHDILKNFTKRLEAMEEVVNVKRCKECGQIKWEDNKNE